MTSVDLSKYRRQPVTTRVPAPTRRRTTRAAAARRDDRPREVIERERAERIERHRAEVNRRMERLEALRAQAAARANHDQVNADRAQRNRGAPGLADAQFVEALAAMLPRERRNADAPGIAEQPARDDNRAEGRPLQGPGVDDESSSDSSDSEANAAPARRNVRAADNNERSEEDSNREASRSDAGSEAQRIPEQHGNRDEGPRSVGGREAQRNEGAGANEGSDQGGDRAERPRAVAVVFGPDAPGGDDERLAANNARREGGVNQHVVINVRGGEDVTAAVVRAAFPEADEARRAVLMRNLRNGEDRAAALQRQLVLEEEELLWGPRLPARRRLMMARRAVRDGQLDALAALEEEDHFDVIAHMEALELQDQFERLVREPPRRLRRPQPPPEPRVQPYLRELRALEESAKIKPCDVSEGLELVTPSPEFDTEQIFIKRVTACVGWAIHGLIFEMVDGTRHGTLLVNPGERPMELNDKNLINRACVGWTDVEYGDYIVGMRGDNLGEGVQSWFCYALTLEFASGMTVSYEANHEPWRGDPFSFRVPTTKPCFVHRIAFKNDQKEDMLGLATSIHLPMTRATLPYLPLKQQKAVGDVLEIGRQVDMQLENGGRKPMGEDVWWLILGFLRGWELLPPSANVKGSKDGQRLFDLYASRHEYRLPC